tara:strand:+ start:490 stop:717 length:228 start_codon:yes stop_codon:yes gene_type:complete
MLRFLFVALGIGMLLPTAVNAESYWLVLLYNSEGFGFEKIEMESMAQCQQEAARWKSTKIGFARGKKGYACIRGK